MRKALLIIGAGIVAGLIVTTLTSRSEVWHKA